MTVLSFILIGLLFTAASPLPMNTDVRNITLPEPGICGRSVADRITNRIAGGKKTALNAYPWTALLGFRTSNVSRKIMFFCGGSLISDQFVLTAAHCLFSISPDSLNVILRLGEWDIESEVDCNGEICSDKPIDFDVTAYRLHESYYPKKTFYDIALIKLPHPVEFTKFVSPVCLPLSDDLQKQPKVGRLLTVIGWGDTEKGAENPPFYSSRYKKETNIPVIDSKMCRSSRPLLFSEFCAENSTDSQSCKGDSGGSVVAEENDGFWYQYGIVSFGSQCKNYSLHDNESVYGVFARVTSFLPWIMKTMRQMSDTSNSGPANME